MGFSLKSASAPLVVLSCLLLLPLVTLWPALQGPFLFDDGSNLDALSVLEGEVTWSGLKEYLAAKASGPTGRPLSMLSFLLNDVYWPSEPWSFKYTNLLIHILNGLLLAWLVLAIVRQWAGRLTEQHMVLAALVAAFWVLNPYQLSSVAYVVQRMAMLAATCVLAGLLLYLAGRRYLLSGDVTRGYGLIWLGYLVGAGIGSLCKENAALFVLLAPLLEWLLFPGAKGAGARPKLLVLTILMPAVLMLIVLGSYFFTSAYSYTWFRDFTLAERLLSQTRAVGYYLWRYLVPGVGYVGLYADGFEKSTGIFQPISTMLWFLVHLLIIGAAIFFRRKLPLFSLGVLFFYVAHWMESGAVPLELFFEHRNYLPSVLLMLGIFHIGNPGRVITIMVFVILACAGLQRIQAGFWGDARHLGAIMVAENPTSERAMVAYAAYLETEGRYAEALVLMREFMDGHPYGIDLALNVVKMGCYLGVDSAEDVSRLKQSPAKYRGKADPMVQQIKDLGEWVRDGRCRTLVLSDLEAFLDAYMAAYRRDGEATQAQYIARAYIDFYRNDYAAFRQHLLLALDSKRNLPLAHSVCSQLTVSGGPDQGCECFRDYFPASAAARGRRTLVQRWQGIENVDRGAYRSEMEAVCAAAASEESR